MTNVSRGTLIRFISGNNSIRADTFKKLFEWIHLQVITCRCIHSNNFLNVSARMLLLPLIKRIKVPRETFVIADNSV